jgi:hypothetical protein
VTVNRATFKFIFLENDEKKLNTCPSMMNTDDEEEKVFLLDELSREKHARNALELELSRERAAKNSAVELAEQYEEMFSAAEKEAQKAMAREREAARDLAEERVRLEIAEVDRIEFEVKLATLEKQMRESGDFEQLKLDLSRAVEERDMFQADVARLQDEVERQGSVGSVGDSSTSVLSFEAELERAGLEQERDRLTAELHDAREKLAHFEEETKENESEASRDELERVKVELEDSQKSDAKMLAEAQAQLDDALNRCNDVDALRNELNAVRGELEQARDHNDDVDDLRKRLEIAHDELENTCAELNDVRAQLEDARDHNDDIDDLREQLDSAKAQLADAAGDEEVRARLEQMRVELARVASELELERALGDNGADVDKLRADLASAEADLDSVQRALREAREQLADAQEEQRASAERCQRLSDELVFCKQSFEDRLAALQRERDELAAKVGAESPSRQEAFEDAAAARQLADRVAKLSEALATEQSQRESAVRALEHARRELANRLAQQEQHADARCRELDAAAKRLQLGAAQAEAGADDAHRRVRALETQVAERSEALAESCSAMSALSAKLQASVRHTQRLEEELAAGRERVARLEAELGGSRARSAQLEADGRARSTRHDAELRDAGAKCARALADLDGARAAVAKLEAELRNARPRPAADEHQVAKLKAIAVASQRELNKVGSDKERLAAQLKAMHELVDDAYDCMEAEREQFQQEKLAMLNRVLARLGLRQLRGTQHTTAERAIKSQVVEEFLGAATELNGRSSTKSKKVSVKRPSPFSFNDASSSLSSTTASDEELLRQAETRWLK